MYGCVYECGRRAWMCKMCKCVRVFIRIFNGENENYIHSDLTSIHLHGFGCCPSNKVYLLLALGILLVNVTAEDFEELSWF